MDPEQQFTPGETHWRAIERLSDALAEAADFAAAIQAGLNILLAALDRPGAALYMPIFCQHVTSSWTLSGLPPAWERDLAEPSSALGQVLDQVLRAGAVVPGSAAPGLAAAFPLRAGGDVAGALLVHGAVIPPAEYGAWLALLRPIARWATQHIRASGAEDGAPSYLDLLRSRNTLRAMFDNLPSSIYIINRDFTLAAINSTRAARAGQEPAHFVGHRCYEAFVQRGEPCPGCRAAETINSGLATQRLNRYWFDADRFIELEISSFPILDEKDAVIQAILIETDVTEKRNLEANLVQSEKLAAVGQLAASLAHEINNPLTAIIANAQLLRRDIPPGANDLLDSVKLIEMAGLRAAQAVRNLLSIARKERYELAPIDLNDTLHNALSLIQHELVGRPVQISLSLEDGIPPVFASQDQLQGVWINLLLNAIDAIDKKNGEISINSHYTGSQFQVAITDNGKGISADHLARIFEPFYTTKSAGRGTGLGLSVCQRVIRQHGGDIRVESQPGSWTRFTVVLPGPQGEGLDR